MLLTEEKSLCGKRQAIVVSKDARQSRGHRAINPDRSFDLRHYKLDGDIVQNEKSCDFLLLNDSLKKAYFIELKGKNINDAVDQLEASTNRFTTELQGYTFFYRIVCSKALTHKIRDPKYRKFQEKYGSKLITREYIEEKLE